MPDAHLLYLDLMKKALSYTLWPEPPMLLAGFDDYPPVERIILSFVSTILAKKKLMIALPRNLSESQRREGRVWPICADTMIGLRRLDNLQDCIETVLKEDVEGDFIETGVWRGGACIFMRAALAAYGVTDRRVFVADSFEGLPEPDAEQYPADRDDKHYTLRHLAVSQENVEINFRRYGLLDSQVVFLKGWFKDTLPQAPLEKLSILRLDADMYGSTMEALQSLYPILSTGGFCIVDDYYAVKGCKSAVDDFRARTSTSEKLVEVDWTAVYWRKGHSITTAS